MGLEKGNWKEGTPEVCGKCGGSGEVYTERSGNGYLSKASETCPKCKGSGKEPKK